MGFKAERFAEENLLDTDFETELWGLLLYGVCIVGTFKDERGFNRFGVEPLGEECESDDAKDAFATFSIAVLVIPLGALRSAS